MIGGFALVAWPASYGETGIMPFKANQQGRVYQSDLGPHTAGAVRTMKEYDPNKKWVLSLDYIDGALWTPTEPPNERP